MTDLDGTDSIANSPAEANGRADDGGVSEVDGNGNKEKKVPLVMAEPAEREPGEGQSNPFGLLLIVGLFALLWFGAGQTAFFFVIGLMVMIFLHELGHYLTARWTGMKVTQFFLFMGPRIWSFHRKGIEYGIRLLPIGAFVRIVGMHNLDPPDASEVDQAYMYKSYPRKMLVITAGSMMHFIQALIIFVIIASFIGKDDPDDWSITEISRLETGETPSEEAGLQPGDTIVSVALADGGPEYPATNWAQVRKYIRFHQNQTVVLSVLEGGSDDGEVVERATTLASVPDLRFAGSGRTASNGYLGVRPAFERNPVSPVVAVQDFGTAFWSALKAVPIFVSPSTYGDLASLVFSGSDGGVTVQDDEANRPISVVGAVRVAGQTDSDVRGPLVLLAILNIFIGLVNLAPLLPLDGGHAAIATYERLRSRKGRRHHADIARLLPLTYAVVFVLVFLMLTTFYLDIVRPVNL